MGRGLHGGGGAWWTESPASVASGADYAHRYNPRMHLHIIGICGTFMGGLAQLARAAGHRVTGCDANVYPPMSTQLRGAGIDLMEGFGAEQMDLMPDVWVVGNVAARGMPIIEAILNARAPMISGPQWLAENLLGRHRLLAVAGTHGKTTTSSLLAWLLEDAGHSPSFLIGGVPENFGVSARLSAEDFVIEADEYDTAFFDKRSKFLHLRAEVAVLNNLEFDHADIFPDLGAIETQFHHWIRTLPASGRIVVNAAEPALQRVLARGSWTPRMDFNTLRTGPGWSIGSDGKPAAGEKADGLDRFDVLLDGVPAGMVASPLTGQHNRLNVLAAVAAAVAAGVPAEQACASVAGFTGVKRRMQLRGEVATIQVLDDFAHHPTAIATTISGLRERMLRQGAAGRILAVIEPRSNTMKLGVMASRLAESLASADHVFAYSGGINWDLSGALAPLGSRACIASHLDELVAHIAALAHPGDRILVMSNGGFGGIHDRIIQSLEQRQMAQGWA